MLHGLSVYCLFWNQVPATKFFRPGSDGALGVEVWRAGSPRAPDIVTRADERGIKWYIAGGGSQAMRLVKKIRPKGVIGIACYDEALMALSKFMEYDIPTQAILLSQDGCVNTQVDINAVRRVLESE